MTLQELNEHLELLQKCEQAKSLLRSFREADLRAACYDGMPHGSGVSDKVGRLAVEIDEMERRVRELEAEIEKSELPVFTFISGIEDSWTRMLFRLRFIRGMEWKEVASIIGGGNTVKSVANACYRYLGIKVEEQ